MTRASHICSMPGCPAIIDAGSRCEAHAYPASKTRGARGYERATWRLTAKRFLTQNATCARCQAAATIVHHIDERGVAGPRWGDPTNLEPLCRSCHSKHHARQPRPRAMATR